MTCLTTIEQIVANCLPQKSDKRGLAVMGFLTLGNRFFNNVHNVIDDWIDMVFRGTQALTIVCARFHDHKFAPNPSAEYYSLYGVFSDSSEKQMWLIHSSELTEAYLAYEKELQKQQEALKEGIDQKQTELAYCVQGSGRRQHRTASSAVRPVSRDAASSVLWPDLADQASGAHSE